MSCNHKWFTVFAEDYCKKVTDGTHDSPKKQLEGKYLITSRHLKEFSLDLNNAYRISESDFNKINERSKVDTWDIMISMIGTVGNIYLEKSHQIDYAIKNVGLFKMGGDVEKAKWLYYYLKSPKAQEYIKVNMRGSTQQYIPLGSLRKLPIKVSAFNKEMNTITHILSTLDEKIETNNQINEKLEEMAQALFKHWFVDFEFPNENGEPYKSSGGEMVESELGMIPKGWRVGKVGEIIQLFDHKRIPLSKKERDKRDKIYPYYGAASLMDYVDDFIFNGLYILLGEDGTVVDDSGYPIIQYVWGKFWVNNHAHVIKGIENISEDFIYLYLRNINVNSIVTGAVQKKISQQNLKNLKALLPNNYDLIKEFSFIVNPWFTLLRNNIEQNRRLEKVRDTLLPKLMSGEIRVPVEEEK
ncbi:restriction endonuclease subunit S [Caldibacillus thermoamylovorans]|uniref:restriction endonuclease subunit S n=1 Tax=Caldibacillus thermoamylovorans TaxID=35841 RepID=UPI000D56072C|nr:restriction endonuclease subunit S [Caldibacillus thermoamylovorans]AWI12462.1 restriction endonuclease subunit S [Caldibacillus thermoamylovorans]